MAIPFTAHPQEMLRERGIPEELVEQTVNAPDSVEQPGDGTEHYLRRFPQLDSRVLRVVFNPKTASVITVFFDRRV